MANKVPDIRITEPSPQDRRIAWWVENSLVRFVKRTFNAIKDGSQQLLHFSLKDWVEDIEGGLISLLSPYIDWILQFEDIPTPIRTTLERAKAGEFQGGAMILMSVGQALVDALAYAMQHSVGLIILRGVNRVIRPYRFDPFTAIELWRKGALGESTLDFTLAQNGVPDTFIPNFKRGAIPETDDTSLLTAYWRGLVSQETVRGELDKRGYTEYQKNWWIAKTEYIPNPNDLISMAVREAFNDGTARRFGYDENFPGELAEWGNKQGVSTEWLRRFWRAHWQLPGSNAVREMYQRGIIGREDVDLYLLAADIPAFWREKYIDYFYRVPTRVDVRRMYKLGVIQESELVSYYTQYGYSPTDAERLTQWTIAEYAEEDRDLTKTDILGMYREGILNPTETNQFLEALGYRESDIGLLLAREDLKRQAAYEKEVVESTKDLYLQGDYDRTDVFSQLGRLDSTSAFIEEKLTLWDLEKRRRVVRPSVTQLRDMWQGGVITQTVFRQELLGRGYTSKYVDWYIELWKGEG